MGLQSSTPHEAREGARLPRGIRESPASRFRSFGIVSDGRAESAGERVGTDQFRVQVQTEIDECDRIFDLSPDRLGMAFLPISWVDVLLTAAPASPACR